MSGGAGRWGNEPWVVGKAEGPFGVILDERAGTRVVRVVAQVVEHYREHGVQFDIAAAEGMLASMIGNPKAVYQGKKASTTVAIEGFDEEHYLVVPIKSLPGENWLETLFVEKRERFERRKWAREGLLYRREGD